MEERFTVPTPMQLNSMVVKLNSGAILLFAPVRVRDEVSLHNETQKRDVRQDLGLRCSFDCIQVGFGAWLESLGKVSWIVVASSFHTLSLPNVLSRFPEAKVTFEADSSITALPCL